MFNLPFFFIFVLFNFFSSLKRDGMLQVPEVFSCSVCIMRQSFPLIEDDKFPKTSKVTSSSCALTLILPSSTPIPTLTVFIKGLTQIKGTSVSSSISMTMKSTGNVNSPTFTITSSTTPWGYFIDLSTTYNVILVRLATKYPILFIIDMGIKFMLSRKSNKVFFIGKLPKLHE